MCGAGRAVRPRIRRNAGQSVLRRRAGVAHVLCSGQTGQQLLLGAYQASVAADRPPVTRDASAYRDAGSGGGRWQARGIVDGDLVTGEIETYARRRRGAGHRRVRQCLLPFHQRQRFQRHRDLAGTQTRSYLANPCYTQIHPTCIPRSGEHQSKLTLMSETLRNDGRIWVPKTKGDTRSPDRFPRPSATITWNASIPAFGNMVPRDVASRDAKNVCDEGRGVGTGGLGVYLDFADAIKRMGENDRREVRQPLRYVCADHREDPYRYRCGSIPPIHYTMGGLWVDYDLQSTVPGLFVIGEANFSDHGANRLGASALMQGLADGYFVLPQRSTTIWRPRTFNQVGADHPEVIGTVSEVADSGVRNSC